MENAVTYVKQTLLDIPPTTAEAEAKETLVEKIREFMNLKIIGALTQMIKEGSKQIRDGDVILTYGLSQAVERVIMHSKESGTDFSVVVVDSEPELEGRAVITRLSEVGIKCTYAQVHSLPFVIKGASKLFLGATAMLSNGYLISQTGTAMVACMCNYHRVPVVVFSETYKFSKEVMLDSFAVLEVDGAQVH